MENECEAVKRQGQRPIYAPRIEASTRVDAGRQIRAWLAIGTQSVGGGASVLYLIRRVIVDRERWITPREFLENWALSRLSLGMHMIALPGLIGARLDGARGTAISVLAMIVPASLITVLMTAGYGFIREQPLIVATLTGIAPVTAGLAIGMSIVLIRTAARKDLHGVADWLVAVAAIVAGLLWATPIPVIAAGIVIGPVLLRGGERGRAAEPPEP